MTATVSEIQDYLEKNHQGELDDKIKDKSKDRVYRQQAQSIKKNKALPHGQCNICSRPEEKLVPITMRICATCAGKLMKRGGGLKVLQKIPGDYCCDNCFARCFITLYVNPQICQYCANKIGRFHKYHKEQKKETEKKMTDTKKELYNKGENNA